MTGTRRFAVMLAIAAVCAGAQVSRTLLAESQNPAGLSPTPAAAGAPAGNTQNGKRLYERDGCWQCHGFAGQGGRGVPDTVPLAGTALDFAAFVKYVRQPVGVMPAYTNKVISDQELADVYAHIKTFAGPRPASQIPLLNELAK
jgi:mono/diheme cytochrome c family protein